MSMSRIVIMPVRQYVSSTSSSFSTFLAVKISLSFLKRYSSPSPSRGCPWSSPRGSAASLFSRNRRSRRVRMPTSLPLASVIGKPLTFFCFIISWARLDRLVGRQRDGIENDAVGRALDLVDLLGLLLDRHVLVDDADAAFLGQGDRHLVLGHRVHRRAEQRNVESDPLGEPRAHVQFAGHDVAERGSRARRRT